MIVVAFYVTCSVLCAVRVERRGHIDSNDIKQHDLRFIFNRQKPFDVIMFICI